MERERGGGDGCVYIVGVGMFIFASWVHETLFVGSDGLFFGLVVVKEGGHVVAYYPITRDLL